MDQFSAFLTTEKIGRKRAVFASIDSTNNYAKKYGESLEDGTVIIAGEQTDGRGRMGREWISPANKGIFMTIFLKPKISSAALSPITQIAAVAVISALNKMDIHAGIKWPNDILLNGKKICGILTEAAIEEGLVRFAVVGIGINHELTEDDIPSELKDHATSLHLETGKLICPQTLTAEILNDFEKLYKSYIDQQDLTLVHQIAREKSAVIGRKVKLSRKPTLSDWQEVYVEDIGEDGSLVVSDLEGRIARIVSGEISLRLVD